jgi:hypothetical protein
MAGNQASFNPMQCCGNPLKGCSNCPPDEFEQWWALQRFHPKGPVNHWKAEFRKCFYDAQEAVKCNMQ